MKPGFKAVFGGQGKTMSAGRTTAAASGEEAVLSAAGRKKKATGKENAQDEEAETQADENLSLPNLSKGENLSKPDAVDLLEKETKPPKRFT